MNQQPTAASLIADSAKWVWDNYGEGFSDWLKEKAEDKAKEKGLEVAQNRWKTFQWQRAEKGYREKLAKLYGTTRILGNSEPTPLEGIFTDLYILDKPLAMRRYSLDDLQASDEKLRGHELQRCEGIEVVRRSNSHRLFILGKPGAGKTTFLKYITLQAVKGELPQTPIFVGLREWSESNKTLMEFIIEQFAICNFPKADSFIEYFLEKGKAILLLDGLDEVNNEHNKKVIKSVKDFCKKYDKTQCLITCRVASVDYSFDSFKYMEVADFTLEQIEIFVTKWFAKEPIKCEKFLTEFKQEQYRGVRELASSPLLLGMLCLAFADTMQFSTRRVDIYDEAIDALLRTWDGKRAISRDIVYKNLNHHWKKRLFLAVAYNTFKSNQYLIKEQELISNINLCLKRLPNPDNEELDGEIVLKSIEAQHGIFVERAQKIHSFAHLTFQEYFAACAIKNNPNYQKELMKHITDPRWREVFLLTASLLDDADEFFDLFRNAIDDLIREDKKLVEFLQWIQEKSSTAKDHFSTNEITVFYIFLESLNFYKLLQSIRNIIKNFELDNSFHLLMNYAFDINCNFNRIIERVNILESYSKNISCDYLCYWLLKTTCFFAESNNYNFYKIDSEEYQKFLDFYVLIINKASNLDFNLLSTSLNNLKKYIPHKNSTESEWKIFVKKLISTIQKSRNLPRVSQFTHKQKSHLITYFLANSLLLDCLELATVSDREAIKNSLFLPPVSIKS